jgi:hypothetical protein
MVQSCRLMSDQPQRANSRNLIALLPPAVGILALELNLGLKGDGPRFSRPAAQDVSAPVLIIGRLPGLLRESVPTCGLGSD